jgi:hypothetical protein
MDTAQMDEIFSTNLALFDFVPVFFFLIGAYFAVQITVQIGGMNCGRIAAASSVIIFLGGFLKAVWKLLYTAGVIDIQILRESQYFLIAPGYVVFFFVVAWMAYREKLGAKRSVLILAMATWKIPLLILMTLSSIGVQGGFAYISFRRGVPIAAAGFLLALVCLVSMGALASGEQTISRQWIEEAVNALGQFGFLLGSFWLHRKMTLSQT